MAQFYKFLLYNAMLLLIATLYYNLPNIIIGTLLKNAILLYGIDTATRRKLDIGVRIQPKESYPYEFMLFFTMTSLMEAFGSIMILPYLDVRNDVSILDITLFIPLSFLFEILFDLFHYIMHYFMHRVPFLYRNIHKVHHKFPFPTPILTFYQHPLDVVLTNILPLMLTLYLTSFVYCVPKHIYYLLMVYKTSTEITGHCGKVIRSTCFPQCMSLPKLLNIEISPIDHDLHHTNNNCNYSKRFKLWDIFGVNLASWKVIDLISYFGQQ